MIKFIDLFFTILSQIEILFSFATLSAKIDEADVYSGDDV
jgi:hypothetical protein